ncbi:MAG: sugar phosphate nucleotidyltransferase [Vulcanimicrobiota bacterium]
MKAMILAAGGASRLYPLTYTLPMVMVPVVNVPVVEHLICLLKQHGFDEIMVNLHYLHRVITDHLGDGSRWGVKLSYSHEEELSGTAGGVKRVADFFDDTFLVIGGDDLTDLDLSAFLTYHRQRQSQATLAAYPISQSDNLGVLALDDQGRVTQFHEKPRQVPESCHWVNSGIYLFEPSIFELIPDVRPFDFGKHLFPTLVTNTEVAFYGYPIEAGYWCDIEDPIAYRRAHWDVLEGLTDITIPGREVQPQVWLADGCQVSSQAILVPPVVIGEGTEVRAGARIEGPAVLGPQVVVEEGARVRSSVIWDHTRLGAGCLVEDSLVGSSCLLEANRQYRNILMPSGAQPSRRKVSQD